MLLMKRPPFGWSDKVWTVFTLVKNGCYGFGMITCAVADHGHLISDLFIFSAPVSDTRQLARQGQSDDHLGRFFECCLLLCHFSGDQYRRNFHE